MSNYGAFGAFGTSGAFGAFGAFGGSGGAGAFGAFGAFGGPGAAGGYSTYGLIVHRDGIVGSWHPPTTVPVQLSQEDVINLPFWEPWVRAELIDFDLMTHLHFAPGAAGGFTLWHTVVTPPPATTPATVCLPIATLVRPPDGETFWLEQLGHVANWSDLRQDRAEEILSQLSPPLAYWGTVLNLHPERRKWTLELLGVALRLANFVEMRFKHSLACRRPIEYSPQIQPLIQTPGHGSLPSGHATEAFIVAFVLWQLVKPKLGGSDVQKRTWLDQLMRQAARVAINRTVAGVHFPVDSAAGQLLGLTLGAYLVARVDPSHTYTDASFDGTGYPASLDFDWRLQYDVDNDKRTGIAPWATLGSAAGIATAPLLARLWSLAQAEWP